MAFLDYLIPIIIVASIALAVICKATGQTLPELMEGMGNFFQEKKEDVTENTIGVYDR